MVTANKGPLAHGYRELRDRAAGSGPPFSSIHGDGRRSIFGARGAGGRPLASFRAILNSTTNYILTAMEQGTSFDDAVRQAQAMGVAEADPSNDVDGWDAATKVAVLANVLMDGDVRPARCRSHRHSRRHAAGPARDDGEQQRIKLLCRAWREGGVLKTRVAPEPVA